MNPKFDFSERKTWEIVMKEILHIGNVATLTRKTGVKCSNIENGFYIKLEKNIIDFEITEQTHITTQEGQLLFYFKIDENFVDFIITDYFEDHSNRPFYYDDLAIYKDIYYLYGECTHEGMFDLEENLHNRIYKLVYQAMKDEEFYEIFRKWNNLDQEKKLFYKYKGLTCFCYINMYRDIEIGEEKYHRGDFAIYPYLDPEYCITFEEYCKNAEDILTEKTLEKLKKFKCYSDINEEVINCIKTNTTRLNEIINGIEKEKL